MKTTSNPNDLTLVDAQNLLSAVVRDIAGLVEILLKDTTALSLDPADEAKLQQHVGRLQRLPTMAQALVVANRRKLETLLRESLSTQGDGSAKVHEALEVVTVARNPKAAPV